MPVCIVCGQKVDRERYAFLATSDGTKIVLCDMHASTLLEVVEDMCNSMKEWDKRNS